MTSDNPDPADLDLLAFRYVAGELTAAEAEAFEEQLACDQTAREAVASAVQVAEAVAALAPAFVAPTAQPLPASSPRRGTWRERVRWMIVGAVAACVAIVAGWQFLSNSGDDDLLDPHVIASAERVTEINRVVALWVDPHLLDQGDGGFDSQDGDDSDLIIRTTEGAHDVHVPDWVLAAVSDDEPRDEDAPEGN